MKSVLAFAALAAAAPAVHEGSFSVHQVPSHMKLKHGAVDMEKTYKKYGKDVPPHIHEAAVLAMSGSVAANPEQYDQAYLCPVSIGSNSQQLNLDFDTGSSDLWVFSSLQPSSQRSGHSYYTPGSSAVRQSGETWRISYGDGSGAAGVVYSDKVVIGGVTATSQAVEAATSVSAQFQQDTNNDGLVGLAFDSINTASPRQVKTFYQSVSLNQNVFTSYLRHAQAGSYDFGVINSSKYSGSIVYVPVNSGNGFWEFTAQGYSVGSTARTQSLDCIADTGTSLIYLPDAVIANYYSQVSGAQNSQSAGGYVFPCSSSLPSFGIKIGGTTFTVPGSYINYAPYSGNTCYGGLQSSSGIGFNILGDVFLKAVFVVFDFGNTRLGFAAQR